MSEESLYKLPPTMTREDALQEHALAKLENRRSRGYLRAVASKQPREYGYGLLPQDDWQNPFAPEAPDPSVVQTLIEWVMSQERHVAVRVMDYLDNPGPDTLEAIREVVDIKVAVDAARTTPMTLTDLIIKNLPCDVPTMYDLARREHLSKRPEAAVRQIIRNLTRRGIIAGDSEGVYHVLQRRGSGGATPSSAAGRPTNC